MIPALIAVMIIVAIRIRFAKPAIEPLSVHILVALKLWHVFVRIALLIILIGLITVIGHAV